jgi:hypothetical protein
VLRNSTCCLRLRVLQVASYLEVVGAVDCGLEMMMSLLAQARAEQKGVTRRDAVFRIPFAAREQLPTTTHQQGLASSTVTVQSLRLFSVSRLMQVFLLIYPDASLLFSQCCANTLNI